MMNAKLSVWTAAALFWAAFSGQAASQASSVGTASTGRSGKPRIKFESTVYDFGKTSQVETVSGTFHFQNAGDATLKVAKPTTTCGCTVAAVKPDVLQPGEKGELSFTINLGRYRALLQKQITVESNDPDQPKVVLNVKADYTPLFEITPVSFSVHLRQGESTNLTARVTRTDGKPLTIAKLVPTQPWVEAKVEPETASNTVARIETRIKAEGPPQFFTDVIQAFVDGSEKPAFSLFVSGRITGDLVLSPENIYWPVADPEKAMTRRSILVKSLRAEKLELRNLSSSLTNVAVRWVPRDEQNTIEVLATLADVPKQTIIGAIRFETNVPDQPKVEIPVTISVTKPVGLRSMR